MTADLRMLWVQTETSDAHLVQFFLKVDHCLSQHPRKVDSPYTVALRTSALRALANLVLCLCIQLLPGVLYPVLPCVNKVGASSGDPKGRIVLVPGTHYRERRLLPSQGAEGKHNDNNSPHQWPPRPSYLFLIKMAMQHLSISFRDCCVPVWKGREKMALCMQIFASKGRRPCFLVGGIRGGMKQVFSRRWQCALRQAGPASGITQRIL